MSNVIQFLEKIAIDSTLTDNDGWKKHLDSLDLAPELKRAIESKDQRAVEIYLGIDTKIVCALFPAEDDEPSKDEPSDEEPSDDEIRKVG